ncbi:unnamed protein product, partial [Prunus brigantina]
FSLFLPRLLPLRATVPRHCANRKETTVPPPPQSTSALETGSVRLVSTSRSKPTCFPDRKARNPATLSTGSTGGFRAIAPPPPPSISGESGASVDRTQQAEPSRGRAAWDYL